MTSSQYRKRWIRRHSKYEKIAYRLFIDSFRELANKIPLTIINETNYSTIVESSITQENLFNAYFKVYNEVGKLEGAYVGKQINRQIKEFTLDNFTSEWSRRLFSWLLQNSSYRIVTVRDDFKEYIRLFLANGFAEGKTISELTTELQKLINSKNFYRWQALRIARTETTAAANYATTVASDVSGVLQEKVWVSARDARTRRPPKSRFNHFEMDGARVDQNEAFNVSGDRLMFPGDPKGEAGNVINCRCTHAVVPKRDANGRIIRTANKNPLANPDN